MSVEVKDTVKEKALEILSNLSDREINRLFGSNLMGNDGLTISTTKSKCFLKNKKTRTLELSDTYALQVFYRHTLRKISNLISEFSITTTSIEQIEKAENYLNIYKNIERVYNNHKDNSEFDSYVRKVTHIIFGSLVIEDIEHVSHVRSIHDVTGTSVKRITILPSFKEKRLKELSNSIKECAFATVKR